MLSKEKLERINFLANKAKSDDLTENEKKEQEKLRSEYIAKVRQSFKNQLKTIKVVDPEGKDVTPEKLKQLKDKNNE